MREAIRRLNPGAYEYVITYKITSDGFDEPITIKVRAEVKDSQPPDRLRRFFPGKQARD